MTAADVAIVGGGVIGACCAYELAGAGARVVVLERGGGWGEGCSWGNAGLIVPSHSRPLAAPENLRAGLGWMLRRDSPFGLRLRPSLAAWLVRYLRASTSGRAAAGEALQRELARESLELLRGMTDLDTGFAQRGCLTVHTAPDGAERAAEEAASETGRALGARVVPVEEARRELEPALSTAVTGAVLFPHEAECDPVRLVRAFGAAARDRGAELHTATEAVAIRAAARGVDLETTRGTMRAGYAVIAAGAWSGRLAASLGIPLPLQGGKGYALEFDPVAAPLRLPLYLHDQRVVANPMADRVRMTGGLILDGLDERFEPPRARAIRDAAQTVLGVRAEPTLAWRGLRPCAPDGLPVIGAHRRAPRVALATGHGMLGVTLGPLTGRMIADVVAGRDGHPALARLSPERFG